MFSGKIGRYERFGENSLNQLTHHLAHAIHKIKNSACWLNANIALGFALCYISILATHLVLYFMYSTHSNALTNTYRSLFIVL